MSARLPWRWGRRVLHAPVCSRPLYEPLDSSGSPGLAALELGLFCTPLSQELQKGSLKWEPGDAGGVREKENLIVCDISGKLWADQGVKSCE